MWNLGSFRVMDATINIGIAKSDRRVCHPRLQERSRFRQLQIADDMRP
jgi:hypothetical protein